MLNNKTYYAVVPKYLVIDPAVETLYRTRALARQALKLMISNYSYAVVKVHVTISWKT